MAKITTGDRIFSRRHRSGEIRIDVAGSKVLLGRLIRKDGSPSVREVIVDVSDVTSKLLFLPGLGGGVDDSA